MSSLRCLLATDSVVKSCLSFINYYYLVWSFPLLAINIVFIAMSHVTPSEIDAWFNTIVPLPTSSPCFTTCMKPVSHTYVVWRVLLAADEYSSDDVVTPRHVSLSPGRGGTRDFHFILHALQTWSVGWHDLDLPPQLPGEQG